MYLGTTNGITLVLKFGPTSGTIFWATYGATYGAIFRKILGLTLMLTCFRVKKMKKILMKNIDNRFRMKSNILESVLNSDVVPDVRNKIWSNVDSTNKIYYGIYHNLCFR